MNRIDKMANKHKLKHLYSAITGEPHYAWFRGDLLLYVVLSVEGKYEIRPNPHDMDKVGHIDFTEHIYDTLDEAGKAINEIEVR